MVDLIYRDGRIEEVLFETVGDDSKFNKEKQPEGILRIGMFTPDTVVPTFEHEIEDLYGYEDHFVSLDWIK